MSSPERSLLKLSVLDQSTASLGLPEDQAIRDTIDLAALCETLGYHRFWVSEHHCHPSIVGSAPEILIAAIAQATNRIRVGSAGVMLPHYAPLKVAEQFRVLEAIAPGRIDLGLGRAPGSDGKTAYALNPNANIDAENFPANVRDLIAWVSGTALVDGHPHRGLGAHPTSATAPEVWMLGTSDFGAQLAAHFGIPYSFAHFITEGGGVERALDLYRQNYQPSERHPTPQTNVCVWALAAESQADAEFLFSSRAFCKIARDKGDIRAIEAPKALADYGYNRVEKMRYDQLRESALIGSGDQVADKLHALATQYEIDEITVLTWTYNQTDRRRSYELLAKSCGLI